MEGEKERQGGRERKRKGEKEGDGGREGGGGGGKESEERCLLYYNYSSSLIKSYPRFCQETASQQPDRILKDAPPPPRKRPSAWWVWLTKLSSKTTLRTMLSIVGPVLIAMAIYFYANTRYIT